MDEGRIMGKGWQNAILVAEGINMQGAHNGVNNLGTDGFLLIGNSSGFAQGALPTSSNSSLTVSGGAGTLNLTITAPVSVGNGGTGAITFTDGGILLGSGAGAITATASPTNGQLLIGSTAADPTLATLASADSTVGITNGAGTIDLSVVGGGLVWSVEVGGAVAGVVNHGYITNLAGGVTVTLPNTAAVGSILRICGMAGLWVLAQNAGETVYFGNTNTTTGVGGSLTATNAGDCVELVCIVANVDWRVLSSIGTITIA